MSGEDAAAIGLGAGPRAVEPGAHGSTESTGSAPAAGLAAGLAAGMASREQRILALALAVLVLLATWVIAGNGDLAAARAGFSPEEFVLEVNQPDLMAGDYPSGAGLFRSSSFMWVYVLAERWLGLAPDTVRWAVVFLEIALTALLGVVLVRTLVEGASPAATFAVVVLFALSSFRNPDLARWGAPLYYGLYYTVADVLRVAGVLLVLRRRYLPAALLLGLAFTAHPTMGVLGVAFAGAVALVDLRRIPPLELAKAAGVFLAIAVPWTLWFVGIGGIAGEGIPAETWIAFARMNNFHFFPWEFGTFGRNHEERLFPFIASVLLALAYWARPPEGLRFRHARRLMVGFAAAALLAGLGVLFSVLVPSPTLVKLALHRVTDLILLFSCVVVGAGLATDLLTGERRWRAVLAAVLLGAAFVVQYGVPLGLALVAVLPVALMAAREATDRVAHAALRALAGLTVALIAWYAVTGLLDDWRTATYLGVAAVESAWPPLLAGAGLLVLAALLPALRDVRAGSPQLLCVVALCLLGACWAWTDRPLPDPEEVAKARHYKALQLWVSENTEPGSLVMPEPTLYYGWRAYSQRPSFGNLREWTMAGWLYASDRAALEEGLRRVGEFGLDIEPLLRVDPPLHGYIALHRMVRDLYYHNPPQWYSALAARYGVRYFVFDKARLRTVPMPIVYENESYVLGRPAADG